MRRSHLIVGAGVLVAMACYSPSEPHGRPGTLTVRAYIDRDASGTYTSGDSVLAGITITVSRDGQTTTAATEADGVATFSDLSPGSYEVGAPEDAVSGGVLASNASPAAVISFQGSDATVEFRYAFFPGRVSGVIYRDDNTNGTLDPTDTRGAGLTVYLRIDDNGTAGAKVDSVLTAADGTYDFARVAPGKYFVEFENPATITYAGGALRPVTVVPLGAVTESATYTGSLILPILDVRAKSLGSVVAVRGNMTVLPGIFPVGSTGTSEVWIEDASSGIAVINVPTADAGLYAPGDLVEVSGTLSVFNGQLQINSTSVTRLGAGTVTPKVLTVPQAVTRAAADEGRLITLANVTVKTVGGGTSAAFNVTVSDAANNTTTVRVNGAPTGLTRASFTVGDRYNVTGVLTQFNGSSQMKPRSPADVAVAASFTPIGTARAGTNGTVYTVTGNLTAAPGAIVSGTGGVNSEIWVQDATGGISVFTVPTADSVTLKVGDKVEITGTLAAFSGQLELTSPSVTRVSAGSAPAPKIETGTSVNAKTDDGQLVQLDSWIVTTVGGGTGASFNVSGTAADGQTVVVRVSSAFTGLSRAVFTVGFTYSVVGVLSQNGGNAQIKIRTRSDVIP